MSVVRSAIISIPETPFCRDHWLAEYRTQVARWYCRLRLATHAISVPLDSGVASAAIAPIPEAPQHYDGARANLWIRNVGLRSKAKPQDCPRFKFRLPWVSCFSCSRKVSARARFSKLAPSAATAQSGLHVQSLRAAAWSHLSSIQPLLKWRVPILHVQASPSRLRCGSALPSRPCRSSLSRQAGHST